MSSLSSQGNRREKKHTHTKKHTPTNETYERSLRESSKPAFVIIVRAQHFQSTRLLSFLVIYQVRPEISDVKTIGRS